MATTSSTRTPTLLPRALAVVGAVAANLAVWALARLLGADMLIDQTNERPAQTVDPVTISLFTFVACLAGWAGMAVLERLIPRRAALVWAVLAALVLLVSFAPVVAVEATDATKVALALLHVAAAAVLVPVFLRTARGAG